MSPDEDEYLSLPPAALDEDPLIRNAYISAFVNSAFHGATHVQSQNQLQSVRDTLLGYHERSPLAAELLEEVQNMARTITTAERRLGVSLDDLITEFAICPEPECWKRYELDALRSPDFGPSCSVPGCKGVLYTTSTLLHGETRRKPTKAYCYVSPKKALRGFFLRPGMAELVQQWRKESDREGRVPPSTLEQWMRAKDPSELIGDVSEGWAWRSSCAGLRRRVDNNTLEVIDEQVYEVDTSLVSLPFGLQLSLNVYYDRVKLSGAYSIGVFYLVINNLPRDIRYLQENTFLVMLLPGPTEPSAACINHVLEPLTNDLMHLQRGISCHMFDIDTGKPSPEETTVVANLFNLLADTPARLLLGGGRPVSTEEHFCMVDKTKLRQLATEQGFQREQFDTRDPSHQLKAKFVAQHASKEDRGRIADAEGVNFIDLDRIPGWLGTHDSPPECMHLLFLGLMKYIHTSIILGGGMFVAGRARGARKPWDAFNQSVRTAYFPPGFQRIPERVYGAGRIKAEIWRNTATVYFIPLFEAFRSGDTIPDGDAPMPKKNSKTLKRMKNNSNKSRKRRRKNRAAAQGSPDESGSGESDGEENTPQATLDDLPGFRTSRNYALHYEQALKFSVAMRTLVCHSISANDAHLAQDLLEQVCREYVRMGVHLPPNFHNAMHIEESIYKYGSVYEWWVWAFERHNKILRSVNTNGHGGGTLERTIMRAWWKVLSMQSLVSQLQSLPNQTRQDLNTIELLLKAMAGGPEQQRQQETLVAHLANEASVRTLRLPAHFININLRASGLYPLILGYCDRLWPEDNVHGDGGAIQDGLQLSSTGSIKSYASVILHGRRYGASLHSRGQRASLAYVEGRRPVQIDYILTLAIPDCERSANILLVRRFLSPEKIPTLPWDFWQSHLGTGTWACEVLGELEAVALESLSGVFARFNLDVDGQHLWITVSLDRVRALTTS
ncbi:hypothetical protein BDV93DRAFT_437595 [Ceratobasidium sp. AG-I]|nr:hypothetical protein BDV93DRAFT_437595 [Ceratobasidium sp. AG-I]